MCIDGIGRVGIEEDLWLDGVVDGRDHRRRVDQSQRGHEPRRRQGKDVEDDQGDAPGDQDGVANDAILRPVVDIQPKRYRYYQRQMAPHVDGVERSAATIRVTGWALAARVRSEFPGTARIQSRAGR